MTKKEKEYYYISNNKSFYSEGESFYINGIRQVDTDNSDYNLDRFKLDVRKEVCEYIQCLTKNIVLLAGSGASIINVDGKPDKNYGHSMSMLIDAIIKQYDNEKFISLDELVKICNYNTNFSDKNFNLEDFLSYTIGYKQYVKDDNEKYSNSIDEILKIITEKTQYLYKKNKHKHGAIIKLLSEYHKAPNRLSIVTTNYDSLFEQAALELEYVVFDGFTMNQSSVFDSNIFDWTLSKKIENIYTNEVEYKKNIIDLIKIHGSHTWKREGEKIYKGVENKEYDNKSLIIFPSTNKYMESYQYPYFELFNRFQHLLTRQNTLLISIGFSFSDNHIFNMIKQAILHCPSLSLLVVNKDIEHYSDIDTQFENTNILQLYSMMKDEYRISFLKSTMNEDFPFYLGGLNYDN